MKKQRQVRDEDIGLGRKQRYSSSRVGEREHR